MLTRPRDFGHGIAGFRPIEAQIAAVSLRDGGVDRSASPSQLEEGGSPSATDIRFIGGGIASDFAASNFGSAYVGATPEVVHIAPFEMEDGTEFLMRCRPNTWDRWDGANWFTLGSSMTAVFPDRVYSVVQNNKFILANGVDPIQYWDGNDANPIQELSPDAPIASYITRIGTRLLAARLRIGGTIRPNTIAWSADDDISEWVDGNLGAGAAEPIPEGSGRKANWITGLSTVARGAVIYRQAAIQLGLLTGLGASPFRFTTVDFSHGTESPFSIASGGMEIGDFFMGSDYMPYIFNGESAPVPIGGPIHDELLKRVPHLYHVVGSIDTNQQEYWLAFPSDDSTILSECWIFNIREWATRRKLVWRKRTLPANTLSIGFGNVLDTNDPVVDTVATIVETDSTRVDEYGRNTGFDRIMFGNNNGQVRFIDKNIALSSGTWLSKQFSVSGHKLLVDRTRLKYTSQSGATVAVSISVDGGQTFSTEKFLSLPATGTESKYFGTDHRVVGRGFHIRIRPTVGFVFITELEVTYQDLGQNND